MHIAIFAQRSFTEKDDAQGHVIAGGLIVMANSFITSSKCQPDQSKPMYRSQGDPNMVPTCGLDLESRDLPYAEVEE